jgi:protein SCO1/2
MNVARFFRWKAPLIVCAILLTALAACDRWQERSPFQASNITGVDWGKDFDLLDVDGRPRHLADYRGKVVMLFLGYTNCPDACPTTLAKMAEAVQELGGDGHDVQGLFVTLDPARDTPSVLRQYVRAFNPAFAALWGDTATTAATAKAFKVFFELRKPDAEGFYTVDHSSGIFVFDRQGRLRLYMGQNIWVNAMVHDLKLLLQERRAEDRP